MPKREAPAIEAERVRLRPLARPDLEMTLGWRNRDENRRWFLHSEPISWDQHLRWFEAYSGRDDDFVFVVEDREAGNAPVGQAALYRIDWESRSAEFGRLLIGEPSARGRGLGLAATSALVDFGFGPWGLERIVLEVIAGNDRAVAIYRDCGFLRVEARDGVIAMEALRAEWAGRRSPPAASRTA